VKRKSEKPKLEKIIIEKHVFFKGDQDCPVTGTGSPISPVHVGSDRVFLPVLVTTGYD
jgi:hypothetical protein